MNGKNYFAVVLPEKRITEAVLLAGFERGARLHKRGKLVGFALDYYPEEKRDCEREYGKAIIGSYGTREDAESAITVWFEKEDG